MNQSSVKQSICCLVLVGLFMFMTGCSSAYYATMEKFGKEKRHILIDNVEDVQDSQAKAQEEFKDALTRIKELYAFDGKELEAFYKKVKSSYEDCDDRAKQIENRIGDVKSVATDLFKEWDAEIAQISDVNMKNSSKQSLKDAKIKYAKLETVMKKSMDRMAPVLSKLNDYVLYLKHNLNAKAVGSLGSEVVSIEKEVTRLIADMNTSIKEADHFIKNF
ncbi:MAG: DUF2959 domain-containing protein [Pseudomonadota bacterium]